MDFPKKRKTEENGDANSPSPPQPQPQPQPQDTTTTTLSPEDIRKILQPFTHDQLLDLLQSACLQHPDVLSSARSLADRDSTLRKLFVRGLSPDTSSDTLRSVFSDFGNLDEAIVIFDKNTAKSKGYGFVTFSHVDGAILALKHPSKKIDGRITVTQLAASGGPAAASSNVDVAARKVFVGNVPFDISSESLLTHFMTYGEIEEGPLGFDKGTGKTRGFAFFVYKTEEGARACLVEPMKNVDGHQVFCKLAVDNKKNKPGGQNNHSYDSSSMGVQVQQQQQASFNAPMLISQYGGYGGGGGGNGYGVQSSVPSYGNPVPAAGGGYSHGIGSGYGNSQFGGDYGARVPPNSAGMASGGYPDGSHYGALPSQPPQPVPMPRPAPPGGMYQGVPPYY